MREPPEIAALRIAMADAADPHAPANRRKFITEAVFDHIISAIENGAWPLGEWERSCIAYGLACIRAGFYDAALNEARMVLIPLDERSMAYLVARSPTLQIDDFRRELEYTRGWPARDR